MFTNYPFMMRPSVLSKGASLAKGFSWAGLLDGTQKTLGVINQAIPIVYQVKPIVNNAKTMFKIADALKSDETSKNSNTNTQVQQTTQQTTKNTTNKPIFYI